MGVSVTNGVDSPGDAVSLSVADGVADGVLPSVGDVPSIRLGVFDGDAVNAGVGDSVREGVSVKVPAGSSVAVGSGVDQIGVGVNA